MNRRAKHKPPRPVRPVSRVAAPGRIVVSSRQLDNRVRTLAQEISTAYKGQELVIVAVMTGSLVFLSDLIRRLPFAVKIELVGISSYPAKATSPGRLRFTKLIKLDLAGRNILLVDDILDTGRTLRSLLRMVNRQRPASVRSCVMLRKLISGATRRPAVDYVGFDVPDRFLVGYGLDHDNLYRNLPDVRELRLPLEKRAGR